MLSLSSVLSSAPRNIGQVIDPAADDPIEGGTHAGQFLR
jgi:hypothetical protein